MASSDTTSYKTTSLAAELSALKEVGSPAELRAAASHRDQPAPRLRVNAHIHLPPNFSAFESVSQAISLADEQQIGVLGVSNYYDYTVYADFVQGVRARGIFPLFGLEVICLDSQLRDAGTKVNDPGNPGKIYLCGKGIVHFDTMSSTASALLNKIRENDALRMARMIERLAAHFAEFGCDTGIDENYVKQMVVRRHGSPVESVYLQERHLCQAFQERFFELVAVDTRLAALQPILQAKPSASDGHDFVGIQNDIRSHLMKSGKPAFVEEAFVTLKEAKQLVLALGGIPAYPTLADGTVPVCPFEESPAALIHNIQTRGIYAAEFIPSRNRVAVLDNYVTALRSAGLVITAGTEHNTLDLIPIEPACKDGPVSERAGEIFWEGACVVAAHQYLTLHGEQGYVRENGELHTGYVDHESRIADFAALGATVIEAFRRSSSVGNNA